MKKVLLWVLTVFVLSGVLVFFPSFGSLFLLICAVVIAPIDAWQSKLKEVRISGAIKIVLIIVLFVAGVSTSSEIKRDTPKENPSITEEEETEQPAASTEPTTSPTNSPEPTEEPSPSPEPTSKPTPEPTAEPTPVEYTEPPAETEPPATQEPVQEEATYHGYKASTTVYVSNSGKIHLKSDCSGMKSYSTMTLGEAEHMGYEECSKCF